MKVTISELNSCKRGMEVEVPPEVVTSEMTKALEAYQHKARIPGFRRGKIPLSVVKQRFGKQVEGEVLSRLIEEFAHRALEEKRIEPIHHPVLDEYDYRQGEPFVFRTTFEVRPALQVEGYRALEVERREAEVTEDRVETALASLRERAAKYSTREGRKAEPGDVVVGSLSGRFLEGKGKNFQNEPITMTAGAEDNHPDFNAALAGIGAGETRNFQVRYPSDYPSGNLAGRLVEYVLAAREVKVKELPSPTTSSPRRSETSRRWKISGARPAGAGSPGTGRRRRGGQGQNLDGARGEERIRSPRLDGRGAAGPSDGGCGACTAAPGSRSEPRRLELERGT